MDSAMGVGNTYPRVLIRIEFADCVFSSDDPEENIFAVFLICNKFVPQAVASENVISTTDAERFFKSFNSLADAML